MTQNIHYSFKFKMLQSLYLSRRVKIVLFRIQAKKQFGNCSPKIWIPRLRAQYYSATGTIVRFLGLNISDFILTTHFNFHDNIASINYVYVWNFIERLNRIRKTNCSYGNSKNDTRNIDLYSRLFRTYNSTYE